MSKKTNLLLASALLPFILGTGALAQTQTGGPIRLSEEQECFEPTHPNYNAITVTSTHPTIRACVAAGGSMAQPMENGQESEGQHLSEPENSVDATPQNDEPPQSEATLSPEAEIIDQLLENSDEAMETSSQQTPSASPLETSVPGQENQETFGPENQSINDEETFMLPGVREIANPDLNNEEITEENKETKILEAILDLKVMGPLGTPLTREELTPERILELQARGTLPKNLDDLLKQKTQKIRTSQRVGPKEMEPLENHTYSKQEGFFPPPKAYFGRNNQQFDP